MEVTTLEQCASAYAITNYYHGNVIDAIKAMIDKASDQMELDILSGLLRGSVRHMLDEAQRQIDSKEAISTSQHVADTQGPPTMIGRVGGIPVMKLNDGKRR